MTIGQRRFNRKRASYSRLSLTGVVLAFACRSNDVSPPPPPPPPPAIDAIVPSAAVAGSPDLTLTIEGSHFVDGGPAGSHAAWVAGGDTTLLETVYVSNTQLSAVIPGALVTNAVAAYVLLKTGDVMGDVPVVSSNAVVFTVSPFPPPLGAAVIDAIFPSAAVTGSPDVTLTISGNNFVNSRVKGSRAAWVAGGDTTFLATTYLSSTQLTAVIPAALLSNSVTAQVLLKTGDRMGDFPLRSSNALGFVVTDGTDLSRTGTIIVYGQTTTLPRIKKGSREVSLDGGPVSSLGEGQSLIYSPVAPGTHRLVLHNPCGVNVPATMQVTVSGGQTVTISVDIPANCE